MTTPGSKKIIKKRSPNWADNEVNVLLELWKEYKKKLGDGGKFTSAEYEKMSKDLAEYHCHRSPEEVRTKVENLAKTFRLERTKEALNNTQSEWRFYWQVDEIIGLNPTFCVEYIKDSIERKNKLSQSKEDRATILMFKYPEDNQEEVNIKNDSEDVEQEQNFIYEEATEGHSQHSDSTSQANVRTKEKERNILEELLHEYKETKESLKNTDKKILELLGNQIDLIKTQNELCHTQNAILKSLLEKID